MLLTNLGGIAAPAKAANPAPDSLIKRFESGGGVVTAQITEIRQRTLMVDYNRAVITFRIKSIDAEPLVGNFDLRVGDMLTLNCSEVFKNVGDSCQIFIKYNLAQKRYECASRGNMPLVWINPVSPKILAQLRDLAKMNPQQRVRACREIAGDSKANELVRLEAFHFLENRDRFNTPQNIAEAVETLAALHKIWNQAPADMSYDIRQELDWVLRISDAKFAASPERARFWMREAFRPIAAGNPSQQYAQIVNRGEIIRNYLRDIAFDNVAGVRNELCQKGEDESVPLYIRARVAGVLEWAWMFDPKCDHGCIAVADAVHLEALKSGENEIVLIASDDILSGMGPTTYCAFTKTGPTPVGVRDDFRGATRHDYPNVRIRQALQAALARMVTLEKKFADADDAYHRGRTGLAIDSLKDAIRASASDGR